MKLGRWLFVDCQTVNIGYTRLIHANNNINIFPTNTFYYAKSYVISFAGNVIERNEFLIINILKSINNKICRIKLVYNKTVFVIHCL